MKLSEWNEKQRAARVAKEAIENRADVQCDTCGSEMIYRDHPLWAGTAPTGLDCTWIWVYCQSCGTYGQKLDEQPQLKRDPTAKEIKENLEKMTGLSPFAITSKLPQAELDNIHKEWGRLIEWWVQTRSL